MKIVLTAYACCLVGLLSAQTVILEIDPAVDTSESVFGPNRKYFAQSVYALGFFLGPSDSVAPYIPGRSFTVKLSSLFKVRWTGFLSNCLELGLKYNQIALEQSASKTFPDTTHNRTQKLRSTTIEVNLFQRFNFGKRGDRIGNYVDIGAGVNWVPMMAHVRKKKLPDGRKQKTVNTKLPYRKSFYYTVLAKIGIGGVYFFGQYRLTPLIRTGFGDPALPPFVLGIGFTSLLAYQ